MPAIPIRLQPCNNPSYSLAALLANESFTPSNYSSMHTSTTKPKQLAALVAGLLVAGHLTVAYAATPAYRYNAPATQLRVTTNAETPPPVTGTPTTPTTPTTPPPKAAVQLSTTSLTWSAASSPTDVNSFTTQAVRLTNSGTGVLSILAAPAISGDAAFSSTTNCLDSLAAGGYCDTSVKFSPSNSAPVTGTLSFATSVGAPSVSLTGTGLAGTGQLAAASGSSTDFGTLALGGSATRILQFTNTGTRPVTGVYATVSGSGLSINSNSPNSCGTQTSPGSVAAGASCQFSVTYAPAGQATLSGASASVISTATNSPSSVTLTGSAAGLSDPSFANVTLLLNGESTTDQSGAATPVTMTGVVVSSAQAKFGTSSYRSPGSVSAAISVPAGSASTNLGTGVFTLEMWIRPDSVSSGAIECIVGAASANTTRSFYVCFRDGTAYMYWYPDGTNATRQVMYFPANATSAQQWHHLAVTRDSSGTMRTFMDGIVGATVTTNTNFYYSNVSRFELGREANYGGSAFNGYIDDVRVTKGVARYTGNFTVPTAAFPSR